MRLNLRSVACPIQTDSEGLNLRRIWPNWKARGSSLCALGTGFWTTRDAGTDFVTCLRSCTIPSIITGPFSESPAISSVPLFVTGAPGSLLSSCKNGHSLPARQNPTPNQHLISNDRPRGTLCPTIEITCDMRVIHAQHKLAQS